MKANELRVGNYIIINTGTNEPFCMDYDAMHDTFLDDDWEDLQPIILTEDWLVKFGFTTQSTKGMMQTADCGFKASAYYFILDGFDEFREGFKQPRHKYKFKLVNISNRDFKLRFQYSGYETEGVKLEYVHQLQNLYFALTGEELTIK